MKTAMDPQSLRHDFYLTPESVTAQHQQSTSFVSPNKSLILFCLVCPSVHVPQLAISLCLIISPSCD